MHKLRDQRSAGTSTRNLRTEGEQCRSFSPDSGFQYRNQQCTIKCVEGNSLRCSGNKKYFVGVLIIIPFGSYSVTELIVSINGLTADADLSDPVAPFHFHSSRTRSFSFLKLKLSTDLVSPQVKHRQRHNHTPPSAEWPGWFCNDDYPAYSGGLNKWNTLSTKYASMRSVFHVSWISL
jgi:hypothetical protein